MTTLDRRYDDLVSLIYDGVLCPDAWQTWLDRLVEGFSSCSAMLILQHRRTLAVGSAVCTGGWMIEYAEEYARDFHDKDVWILGVKEKPRGSFYPSQAVFPQQELHKTAFYNDMCRKVNVEHVVGGLFWTEGDWEILLGVHRTRKQGEFNEAEVAWLNRFAPHLRRAVHLGRTLDAAQGTLESALARMPVACVLVNRAQMIIASNDAAQNLIAGHPGLAIRQDRLVVKSTAIAQRLDALIADGFRTLSTSQGDGGGLVTLPGQEQAPIVISVTPFRRGIHVWHQHGGDTVAVLFYDPAQRRMANGEILQAMYGLTPAEARVAVLLSQGYITTEIADALKISVNGVKYHLKAIFGKTGVSRQSELVSRVLSHSVNVPTTANDDDNDETTQSGSAGQAGTT